MNFGSQIKIHDQDLWPQTATCVLWSSHFRLVEKPPCNHYIKQLFSIFLLVTIKIELLLRSRMGQVFFGIGPPYKAIYLPNSGLASTRRLILGDQVGELQVSPGRGHKSKRTQISNRRYTNFPWHPSGWGWSPDPDRDRFCLPSGSVGSIPSRGTSTTGQSEFRD